jgi:3-oxoacyl-ACP reductase-like protein
VPALPAPNLSLRNKPETSGLRHFIQAKNGADMGIFSAIMDKIFHHPSAAPAARAPTPAAPAPQVAPSAAAAAPAPAPAAQAVDVGAVLSQMASQKGGGGNYQSSIVDLLKLLDLDSSLSARKELAGELNVHVGADGSAEENIALHKAVMQKLAENGGKVPDSLKG